MKARIFAVPALTVWLCLALAGCERAPTGRASAPGQPRIVVTYAVLGALVRELVGDRMQVSVLIPNGLDPHEWEPSARDIEALRSADLVVENGLGLEGGMERTLEQARRAGVRFFTASGCVAVRKAAGSEGGPSADDPHIWMDPQAMKAVVDALAGRITGIFAIDLSARARDLDRKLDALDLEIRSEVAAILPADRMLITGHESMGYFAWRYGFTVIGAIVPSLSPEAEASAAELARLKRLVAEKGARAIFTEVGTPAAIAESLARETGISVVPLATHLLPPDGSYFTFMRELAATVISGLRQE